MVTGMDKLIEPLKTTIYFKVKANSVKQEYEKQEELKRSALRAVSALSCIPDSGMFIHKVTMCVVLVEVWGMSIEIVNKKSFL